MKKNTIDIGEQIRYYRKLRNMSQETLALSANTTPAFIGQIERGVKNPTIKTVEKIAAALDMELYELFIPLNSADSIDAPSSKIYATLLLYVNAANCQDKRKSRQEIFSTSLSAFFNNFDYRHSPVTCKDTLFNAYHNKFL